MTKKIRKILSILCTAAIALGGTAVLANAAESKTPHGVQNGYNDIIQNGGFEKGLSNWNLFVNQWNMTYSDNDSNSGDYSLCAKQNNEYNSDSSRRGVYQNIELKANTTYTFSAYFKGSANYTRIRVFKEDGSFWKDADLVLDWSLAYASFEDWTRREISFRTGNETDYTLAVRMYNATTPLLIDDISITENLVPDPGFEKGVATSSESSLAIEKWIKGNSNTYIGENSSVFSGNGTIKFTADNSYCYTEFPVESDTYYKVSFWYFGDLNKGNYRFNFQDADTVTRETVGSGHEPADPVNTRYMTNSGSTEEWKKYEAIVKSGENQTNARLVVRQQAGYSGVHLDEFSVTKLYGIANGDFESSSTWSTGAAGDKPLKAWYGTATVTDGALDLSKNSAWDETYTLFNVEPNTDYRLTFKCKGTDANWVSFKVGASVNTNDVLDGGGCPGKEGNTEWETVDRTFNSGNNTLLYLTFKIGENTSNKLIDDVSIAKTAVIAENYHATVSASEAEQYSLTVKTNNWNNTATIAVPGAEYSLDGTVWQKNNTFANLDSGKDYKIYYRAFENGSYSTGAKTLSIDLSTLPEYGDINNDKQIDITDLAMLRKYLLGIEQTGFNTRNANANGSEDNEVNILDLVALKKLFAE